MVVIYHSSNRIDSMKLSNFRRALARDPNAALHVMLPDGDFVPGHFHVTEIGRVHKQFVDCGGTQRETSACTVQVWVAADTDHRLTAGKLAMILKLAAPILKDDDLDVEIEYEAGVISQYPLGGIEITPAGVLLALGTKHTDCLAPDRCGIPVRAGITPAPAAKGSCGTSGCC